MLARMSKALVKKHSESVAHDTVGSLIADQLIKGVPYILTAIAALSAYLWNQPAWLIILIGSGVFLILTIAWVLISVRLRQSKIEKRNELRGNSLSPKQLDVVTQNECPDKWLHEIADQDKKFIDQRMRMVGCEIIRHDLLNELYVDFKFTFVNASVYAISIDEDSIKGNIYFNARLLSKRNQMIENTARYVDHAEVKDFTVRQWLDRDEIGDILNSSSDADKFRLSGLNITIKGGAAEAGVYPKTLNMYNLNLPSKLLRDLYQKLDISMLSASFNGFYPDGKISKRRLRAYLNVSITNPRPVCVEIQSFKLVTKINDMDYVVYANEGEIRIGRVLDWDKEKVIDEGEKIENLNPSPGPFIILKPKELCAGWLQFDIKNTSFNEPEKLPATLLVIDTRGGEHSMKCTLTYNSKH